MPKFAFPIPVAALVAAVAGVVAVDAAAARPTGTSLLAADPAGGPLSVVETVSQAVVPAPHPRRRAASPPPAERATVVARAVPAPRAHPARTAHSAPPAAEATAREPARVAGVPTPRRHPARTAAALGYAASSDAAAPPAGGAGEAGTDAGAGGGVGAILSVFSDRGGTRTAAAPSGDIVRPGGSTVPAARATSVAAAAPSATPRALVGAATDDPYRAWPAASGTFRQALDALRADRYEETFRRRNGLDDPLERKTIDWLLMRSGSPKVTHAMIAAFAREAEGWPSQDLLRKRLEGSLSRENPPPDRVVAAFAGRRPETVVGARLLARAHLARGDRRAAAAVIRPVWHTRRMSDALQASMAREFADLLTAADHLRRAEMLLYADRASEALALKPYLSSADDAYLDARAAVVRRRADAPARIAAVPAAARDRPGYLFARIAHARRADAWDEAADLLEKAPRDPEVLIDPDEWWVERRIVSRGLVEEGAFRRAYRIAAAHSAESDVARADAEFHAGWYALSFLKDPGRARSHFRRLAEIGSTPITVSRAEYWLGRAAEAAGNKGAANGHYRAAAAYGFTYYGQLARRALGWQRTGVSTVRPGPGDRAAFARNDLVRVIEKLVAAGHQHRVWPLFDHLSETLPTAGQVVLLAELAHRIDKPHIAVLVAKEGQRRGLDVGTAAFPTDAIPRSARVPSGLDRALVYAIARQESTFNTGAISPAGARGLMQLMPGTARAMSRALGLGYSRTKLVTDPGYNVALGAGYLAKRLDDFAGSYVLAFAAYNAGASRSREWVGRFGDPRGGRVDVVDWVEMIPFTETRNYVMRVMENVQVYRELLGTGRLAIEDDLARGRPG